MTASLGCSGPTELASEDECTSPEDRGCVVASTPQRLQTPAVTAGDLAAAVHGNTAFALDLYRQLGAEPGNLFFSPFSVSESLAMTWAGARGATEAEMAKTLHLSLPQSRLHPAFNALDHAITRRAIGPDGRGFVLNAAHGLWDQQGYPLAAPFLETLALDYGAGIHVVDFVGAPDQARGTINGWMAETTDQRIAELLAPGSVTASTRLVVGDAVYFKAAWKTPFDAEGTRFADFTRRDGSTIKVSTMTTTQNLAYGEGAGYAAVALPYDGGALSMVLLRPSSGGIDALEASLSADRLASIVSGLERRAVAVALPTFKINSAFGLESTLARLGMKTAFSDEADFSGINGSSGVSLSAVVHDAFVDVDEAGTEAAAATATGFSTTAAYLPASIHLDQPYIFVIRDDATGTVLFLGRVDDPSL